jgi:hypothetical protein
MMGGGHMGMTVNEGGFQRPGSRLRLAGKAFGLTIFLEEQVTDCAPPLSKAWQTIGTPKLFVIGPTTGAVWSIARGLARNVDAYKGHLAACDLPRRNDLDGRGNLSEEKLAEFTKFFLTICIDQVAFMENLMQPDQLRARILL